MKQFAAKTLGVAALGAAFAAAAVGSASAAEQAVPAVPDALNTVTSTLPVQEVGNKLPAGAPESLAAGQNALAETAANTPMPTALAVGEADPVKGLLGGLPAGALPGA